MRRMSGIEVLLWAVAGFAVGGTLALLFAPHPGEQMRRELWRRLGKRGADSEPLERQVERMEDEGGVLH